MHLWENFLTHQEMRGEIQEAFLNLYTRLVRCGTWHRQGFCTGEVGDIKPIPRSLLIHDVTWHVILEKDRWGKASLDQGEKVSHVRLEPTERIIRDKNNAEIQLDALMFYDCRNSSPRGLKPDVDNVVVFNSQYFQVKSVEPLYDGKRLHHYEIGMVKYAKD